MIGVGTLGSRERVRGTNDGVLLRRRGGRGPARGGAVGRGPWLSGWISGRKVGFIRWQRVAGETRPTYPL